ncbi:MAG TPA: hypothetical protein VM240_01135 [Verrucomicrobiae bacterium]|nr:hypothetical protein [Verrucomicrobiae bacterium]
MTVESTRMDIEEPVEFPMLDARTYEEALAEMEGIPPNQYRKEADDARNSEFADVLPTWSRSPLRTRLVFLAITTRRQNEAASTPPSLDFSCPS